MNKFQTSNLIKSQLPDFVRNDYPKFVSFLEKYYEWLEQTNKVNYGIDSLKRSIDIDDADSFYIDKFKNDLLPYFPKDFSVNKDLFLKVVESFYKSSGTIDSVKFLFRALYNDDIEIYYPKDSILKTSDGKWVLPLALRIDTNDNNIFNIGKTLLTGEKSKATAIVEKVIKSVDRQLGISYIEVYISNIERLFETGETVSATYIDGNTNLPVTVTGRLIGSLSEIKISPDNRGLFYNGYDPEISYDGDPVSIVGGLNPSANNPVGAIAYVGEITKGGITEATVINGGFGFRNEIVFPGSSLIDFKGGFENSSLGTEAQASILLIDEPSARVMNVLNMSISTLDGLGSNTNLSGTGSIVPSSNSVTGTGTSFLTQLTVGDAIYVGSHLREVSIISSDTSLNVTIDFTTTESSLALKKAGRTISRIRGNTLNTVSTSLTFNVHSLAAVAVTGSGGGYRSRPTVKTYSFYNENLEDALIITSCTVVKGTNLVSDNSKNLKDFLEEGDYVRLFVRNKYEEVKKIISLTENDLFFEDYFENDITNVSVFKINRNDVYNLGSIGRINIVESGLNYSNGDILIFTGGSGYGANAFVTVNNLGSITKVTVNNHSSGAYIIGGEGYRRDALPNITVQSALGTGASLRVSEIVGDGVSYGLTTSRIGAISTIRVVSYGYDYVEAPKVSLRNADLSLMGVTKGQIFVSNTEVYQGTSNSSFTFKATVDSYNSATGKLRIFDYKGSLDTSKLLVSDNVLTTNAIVGTVQNSLFYGNGNAKATSKFENGLIRYPGIYLNSDGQVSADKKLQDEKRYHNYSYVITTEVDYKKFKNTLNDIVHPIGTKTFTLRSDDNLENVFSNSNTFFIKTVSSEHQFNIAFGSNNIISTNNSANLMSSINVGDVIILNNVKKSLNGSVYVVSGSNLLSTNSVTMNFINDFQDGDVITLSTGDVAEIKSVSNSNSAFLLSSINVTSSAATVNISYDEFAIVSSLNANVIVTGTTFKSNGSNLSATIQKVR